MIYITNKKDMPKIRDNSIVINIMRPSILSNQWSHNRNSVAKFFVKDRYEAVEKYEEYFMKKVKEKGDFRDEVIRIFKLAKKQHVYLMCCCKPMRCHGDILVKFLIENLGEEIFT